MYKQRLNKTNNHKIFNKNCWALVALTIVSDLTSTKRYFSLYQKFKIMFLQIEFHLFCQTKLTKFYNLINCAQYFYYTLNFWANFGQNQWDRETSIDKLDNLSPKKKRWACLLLICTSCLEYIVEQALILYLWNRYM